MQCSLTNSDGLSCSIMVGQGVCNHTKQPLTDAPALGTRMWCNEDKKKQAQQTPSMLPATPVHHACMCVCRCGTSHSSRRRYSALTWALQWATLHGRPTAAQCLLLSRTRARFTCSTWPRTGSYHCARRRYAKQRGRTLVVQLVGLHTDFFVTSTEP